MRDMIDWERLREVLAAIRRKWRVIGIAFLVYLVLFTEVNLNPDVESYSTPIVTDAEAIAAADRGEWLTVIRFTAQKAMHDDAEAQALLADFYDRGLPPLHVDHCRAFDYYVRAGQNGDLKSQDEVAVHLADADGGYQNYFAGYMWAAHALKMGYQPAAGTIEVYFYDRLSESQRTELERRLSDWKPANQTFEKLHRMPIVPYFSDWLDEIYSIRFCQDPKVYQHILRMLGYR